MLYLAESMVSYMFSSGHIAILYHTGYTDQIKATSYGIAMTTLHHIYMIYL